jgi:Secretion system C-terminal sorting domain
MSTVFLSTLDTGSIQILAGFHAGASSEAPVWFLGVPDPTAKCPRSWGTAGPPARNFAILGLPYYLGCVFAVTFQHLTLMNRIFSSALVTAASALLHTASIAQGTVDIGLFHANGALEVRLRPSADFDGIVSSTVFALRWDRNSDIALGEAQVPDGAPVQTRRSGQLREEGMFNYMVFAGFGYDALANTGARWEAGHEYVLLTIPVTGKGAVELVNDHWTGTVANNADYYMSLGGHDQTGAIYKSLAATTDLDGTVAIKPNPSEGRFQFSFICEDVSDLRVDVVNALGQSTFTENLRAFQGTYVKDMDLTNQSEGIYYLKITRGETTSVHKIVYQ